MSAQPYHEWPFRPPEERSLEENARWWAACYVAGVADRQLSDAPHWTLITGEAGSGKSVALQAWLRDEARRSFIVPYPPEGWPGMPQAWFPDRPGHLPQMVAAAGRAFYQALEGQAEAAARLKPLQREFLRWLLETVGGGRMFWRLAGSLPDELREAYLATPREAALFPTFHNPQDVHGLIDELGLLAQGLGRGRLLFAVDVPAGDTPLYSHGLGELFGWLDIAHHPRLAVVAAASLDVVRQGQVLSRARGRASVVRARWTEAECRLVAARHLHLALGRPAAAPVEAARLAEWATEAVLQAAGQAIAAEYGAPTPGGWVALAETLLYLINRPVDPLPCPVDDPQATLAAWFARHMKLRVDAPQQGVWRGPQFIRLDEQPFRFVALLHQRRGAPANWDDGDVQRLAGSKGNVHSLAARARKAIEPVRAAPVYLVSDRGGGGYRLENCHDEAQ